MPQKNYSLSRLFANAKKTFALARRRDITKCANDFMIGLSLPEPEEISTKTWYHFVNLAIHAPRSNFGHLTALGTVLYHSSPKDPERKALGNLIVGIGLHRAGRIQTATEVFPEAAKNAKVFKLMEVIGEFLKSKKPPEPKLGAAILEACNS